MAALKPTMNKLTAKPPYLIPPTVHTFVSGAVPHFFTHPFLLIGVQGEIVLKCK